MVVSSSKFESRRRRPKGTGMGMGLGVCMLGVCMRVVLVLMLVQAVDCFNEEERKEDAQCAQCKKSLVKASTHRKFQN